MTITITGRSEDDPEELDVRSTASKFSEQTIKYESSACGEIKVELFTSDQNEDRGGITLVITHKNTGQSFMTHAHNLKNGVEISLAGDTETQVFVEVLSRVLNHYIESTGQNNIDYENV